MENQQHTHPTLMAQAENSQIFQSIKDDICSLRWLLNEDDAVAIEVFCDGFDPIGSFRWFIDEFNAALSECFVRCVTIVDGECKRRLFTDQCCSTVDFVFVLGPVRQFEDDLYGFVLFGSNSDPAVIGAELLISFLFEPEFVGVEAKRFILVLNESSGETELFDHEYRHLYRHSIPVNAFARQSESENYRY